MKAAKKIIGFTLGLLLIPLIAMQFTDQVNWQILDFITAGILLGGAAFFLNWLFGKTQNKATRAALTLLVLLIILFIWAELAVGLLIIL